MASGIRELPTSYGGLGFVLGFAHDYDRDHALDLVKLLEFLQETQPAVVEKLALAHEGPQRLQFLHRLQGEIKRGVVDVLRKGIKHGPAHVDLFYGTPTPGNVKAAERFAANIFSVTRQLRYSRDETRARARPGLFINGLPIATFELKNRLTKQTVVDAVQQYQARPRPAGAAVPVRPLRRPFCRGRPRGAVLHPPQGQGLVVPALQQGLERRRGQSAQPGRAQDRLPVEGDPDAAEGLTDILENYAQVVEEKDEQDRQEEAASRSSRATTSSTWCASCWPMPRRTAPGSAT